jgi:hypothetical protein
MDTAYLSAAAALAGSAIGGLTSLAATWLSQNAQARSQQLAQDKSRRLDLYKAFIEEASRLYGDALVSNRAEIVNLVGLYAMVSRMRVMSSPSVIDNADKIVRAIVDTYFAPNKTLREVHEEMKHDELDPLRHFSEACREDLIGRRAL